MTTKAPLVTPRQFWLRERTLECIDAIAQLELSEDWESYREKTKAFAQELLYAVIEWEKYYRQFTPNDTL